MSIGRSIGRGRGRTRRRALPVLAGFLLMGALTAETLALGAAEALAQGSEPRLLIPTQGTSPGAPGGPVILTPVPQTGSGSAEPTPWASPGGLPSSPTGGPPSPPPSPSTARLEVRMTQLEQDLRTVTGRLEDVSYEVRKLGDRLDKLVSDVEYRLSQLEGGGSTAGVKEGSSATTPLVAAGGGAVGATPRVDPAATTPSTATPAPPVPPAAPPSPSPAQTASLGTGSPRDQYARAFAALEKRDYDEAASGFSAFLQANPDDALADNARYWLGETYYARGQYARAAELFLDGYEKNKTGPKAPDTLLKLGLSLEGLDKKREACASFRELNRAFPNAPEAVKQRAAQESKRIPCS